MGHMGHGFETLIWPKVKLKETRTVKCSEMGNQSGEKVGKNSSITMKYKMFSQAKMTNSSAYSKWTAFI